MRGSEWLKAARSSVEMCSYGQVGAELLSTVGLASTALLSRCLVGVHLGDSAPAGTEQPADLQGRGIPAQLSGL